MSSEQWQYETSAALELPLEERLKTFPREPDMTVYFLRSLAALTLRFWLRVYHRLQITGQENLPLEGSYILVANHGSHLDAPALVSALPLKKLHRAFPAAAADYFFNSVARTAFSAIVVNALPFDRSIRPEQSLQLCRKLLDNEGNILIVFPEGTRTLDGELSDFKPGVALLVRGKAIPIIPCYLDGAYRAWPKGAKIPRPYKLRLNIGKPRSFADVAPGKSVLVQIAAELHQAVGELSGKKASPGA